MWLQLRVIVDMFAPFFLPFAMLAIVIGFNFARSALRGGPASMRMECGLLAGMFLLAGSGVVVAFVRSWVFGTGDFLPVPS